MLKIQKFTFRIVLVHAIAGRMTDTSSSFGNASILQTIFVQEDKEQKSLSTESFSSEADRRRRRRRLSGVLESLSS